ncbi:MAG: hypothetical protein M5U28_23940 [Sandaracinaceae bacterium]|nr:hypothetical protein [Sandaracinaceae bacterium]
MPSGLATQCVPAAQRTVAQGLMHSQATGSQVQPDAQRATVVHTQLSVAASQAMPSPHGSVGTQRALPPRSTQVVPSRQSTAAQAEGSSSATPQRPRSQTPTGQGVVMQ